MSSSDHPFKVIHADPAVVEDVVRGFLAVGWADRLDFRTLTPFDTQLVGEEFRVRIEDKIWRVEYRDAPPLADGRPPYLLILLELQSDTDQQMAWRLHEYMTLLEQNLRDAGVVEREGRVPDMLAVVIHNGARPWRATTLRDGPLFGPPTPEGRALNQWRAHALIDYPALAQQSDLFGMPLPPNNRESALILLETAPTERLAALLVDTFERYPGRESTGLRRGMHARVRHILGQLGMTLRPLAEYETMLEERHGGRMTTYLEATVQKWHDDAIAEGREAGMVEGREAGMAEGIAEGEAKGQVRMLLRLAERRFGAGTATSLTPMLSRVVDPERLADIANWVHECDTAGALLGRVRGIAVP